MIRKLAQRGVAAVEFTMVVLMLLLLIFAIVDFGRFIITYQIMMNVSREGANLISRGTGFDEALDALTRSAEPLDIDADGTIFLTQVSADSDGDITIVAQSSTGGLGAASAIGSGIGNTPTLPATDPVIPQPNRSLFIAEIFYQTTSITPLGDLMNDTIGGVVYDAAFF